MILNRLQISAHDERDSIWELKDCIYKLTEEPKNVSTSRSLYLEHIVPIPITFDQRDEARRNWCKEYWGMPTELTNPIKTKHSELRVTYDFATEDSEVITPIVLALSRQYQELGVRLFACNSACDWHLEYTATRGRKIEDRTRSIDEAALTIWREVLSSRDWAVYQLGVVAERLVTAKADGV